MLEYSEKVVRRQQVRLLRFERHLKAAAPLLLAGTAATSLFAALVNEIDELSTARESFAEAVSTNADEAIATAAAFKVFQQSVRREVGLLQSAGTPDERTKRLGNLVVLVDNAHEKAETIAVSKQMRLLGSAFDRMANGTPKQPPNMAWFKALVR